jgi:uncharacterized protein
MTKEKIADLLGRTRDVAAEGRYELYKISQHFDGTAHNPQWLGECPVPTMALFQTLW